MCKKFCTETGPLSLRIDFRPSKDYDYYKVCYSTSLLHGWKVIEIVVVNTLARKFQFAEEYVPSEYEEDFFKADNSVLYQTPYSLAILRVLSSRWLSILLIIITCNSVIFTFTDLLDNVLHNTFSFRKIMKINSKNIVRLQISIISRFPKMNTQFQPLRSVNGNPPTFG